MEIHCFTWAVGAPLSWLSVSSGICLLAISLIQVQPEQQGCLWMSASHLQIADPTLASPSPNLMLTQFLRPQCSAWVHIGLESASKLGKPAVQCWCVSWLGFYILQHAKQQVSLRGRVCGTTFIPTPLSWFKPFCPQDFHYLTHFSTLLLLLKFVFSSLIGPFLVSCNLYHLTLHIDVNLYKLELESKFMRAQAVFVFLRLLPHNISFQFYPFS